MGAYINCKPLPQIMPPLLCADLIKAWLSNAGSVTQLASREKPSKKLPEPRMDQRLPLPSASAAEQPEFNCLHCLSAPALSQCT